MGLDFDVLRQTNARRCEDSFHPINDWSPTDWACAMGGECGEALNLVKKLRRETGPTNRETVEAMQGGASKTALVPAIGRELADLVIYADLLATRLGLNLGDCVQEKFNATSDRIKSKEML